MYKILVFGTGQFADKYISLCAPRIHELYGDFEIVGYLDNNKKKHGRNYREGKIYSPVEGLQLEYDDIAVFTSRHNYSKILCQLNEMFLVPMTKIHYYTWYLKQCYMNRYADSSDPEVQSLLKYWQNHDISMYNLYQVPVDKHEYYEVFDDEKTGFPYIWFKNAIGVEKKLYYPLDYDFFILDGYNRSIIDVWGEQNENSPHKYTKPGHEVAEGDVVIDAGTCEGNFALYWVDVASRLYLFEPDIRWQKPLHYTFAPYENKTTLFTKSVDKKTTATSINLDEAISGTVNFLKMDVEGNETSAISGGLGYCRITM